jgi:hypothetical protein
MGRRKAKDVQSGRRAGILGLWIESRYQLNSPPVDIAIDDARDAIFGETRIPREL